ncbi:hypothetical protein ACG02S_25905 [Roseateles sp. DC23W]|uniref:RES domain-containing protein n=1 Tax=Pelomonas dachongensis TaxID=3299029 RepID=A0ABW7EYU6_9BURK
MINEDVQIQVDDLRLAQKPAKRPDRYQIVRNCLARLKLDQHSILIQRLPGTDLLVGQALEMLTRAEPASAAANYSAAALAALESAGITPDLKCSTASGIINCLVDPAKLRGACPKLPKRFAQHFEFSMSVHLVPHAQADSVFDEDDEEDFRCSHQVGQDTRYPCGLSECDELRMQTEVLRLPLKGFDMSIDQALDELCAAMKAASEAEQTRCNRAALALEEVGLRFHAINKSWRQPRTGGLLIACPNALLAAHPDIEFFEPHQFPRLLIIDRPEKAGNEVRQGLLF